MEKNINLNENERIDELGINNLKVIQNKTYFCFGIDSVLLANFVKSDSSKNVIIDLCSGSGVIPILLSSKVKYSNILAVELQTQMFDLLNRNVLMNELEQKINVLNEDVKNVVELRNNIKKISCSDYADIITVNPPYMVKNTGSKNLNDVKYIARHEEKCTLEDVFSTSSSLLKEKGKLYMVNKPERLVDILSISRSYNLEAKTLRFVQPRVNEKPSIVLIEFSKNGGRELKILPPIIEYNDDGTYTDEIYSIYGWKGSITDDKQSS
ncbi:MAG: tRNA1(Val) (adenine(37)-N6)-methyltransferase [Clostridia bacterium]|nr:tRNA1(Val) (adenine(37)-N6)-methyltransferase [Clostridia bacterium]